MSHAKKLSNGFTLVELMLAMSFVAALLVAIAMTTIQIAHIYNKGLTLREVNQVGRSASEDLQRSISTSMPFNITDGLPTGRYTTDDKGGRLCIGRYSYVWNYGSSLAAGTSNYTYNDGTKVHFAKVNDTSSSLCTSSVVASINKSDATELLATGDRDLVLHKFSIKTSAYATDNVTGQTLYSISMTIGTNDATQLLGDDSSCKPPSSGSGNEDYCSVNQFDIVVRAGNKSGVE